MITEKDHQYFNAIEQEQGCAIDLEQRAWYCATRDTDFSGDSASMWQEYPSTPQEAFQQSNEGCYYVDQMTRLRKEKRICDVPTKKAWWSIRFGILAIATAPQSGCISALVCKTALSALLRVGVSHTATTSSNCKTLVMWGKRTFAT